MVGATRDFPIRFPDHDPVEQRPAKRLRITGKCSAHKCSLEVVGELPTPKRWNRLIPPRSGQQRDEVGVPLNVLPRMGVG